jgi:hypothetical protein
MGWFRNIAAGLRALMGRRRVEREMDEELSGFLEASAEDKRRAGFTPEEAVRAARVEMGSSNAVKHRIASVGWETALERLWQDVRYSLRMLAKSSVFTLVAVLSLALGIGANTAIFSLMNVIMLRSLPVEDPGQLVLFGHGRMVGSTGSLPVQARIFSLTPSTAASTRRTRSSPVSRPSTASSSARTVLSPARGTNSYTLRSSPATTSPSWA